VQAACAAGSPDASKWPRYRLGRMTIAVPKEFRVSFGESYALNFRGPGALLRLVLHRNARYEFDDMNHPRPGQVWCTASYSGYQAEVLAWFVDRQYLTVARWPATWGGEDEGKWVFAIVRSSRRDDARLLRAALHTIELDPVPR
jgi:hypothetical protein